MMYLIKKAIYIFNLRNYFMSEKIVALTNKGVFVNVSTRIIVEEKLFICNGSNHDRQVIYVNFTKKRIIYVYSKKEMHLETCDNMFCNFSPEKVDSLMVAIPFASSTASKT